MKIVEIAPMSPGVLPPDLANYHANDIRKGVKSKKGKENTPQKFGSYKFVPVTGLPEGFYLAFKRSPDEWSKTSPDKFMVTLLDATEDINNPKVVSYIWFNPETIYFGPPNYSYIQGMKIASVGTTENYKGKGYAIQVYKMLVNHGQILFSDTTQTPDGTKLWTKLALDNEFITYGLDIEVGSTLTLKSAYGPTNSENFEKIKQVVFSYEPNQFVLIPKQDTQTINLLNTKVPNGWK